MKKSKAIALAAVCFLVGFWAGAMVINKYFWSPDAEASFRQGSSSGYRFGYLDAEQGLSYDQSRHFSWVIGSAAPRPAPRPGAAPPGGT